MCVAALPTDIVQHSVGSYAAHESRSTRYYADDMEDFRTRDIEQPVPPAGDISDDYVAVVLSDAY